jgi:transcriptional regulator with XRE-family HTH domain
MVRQPEATCGAALQRALRDAGKTQKWLADELSIDPGQVSRWVNNRAQPRIENIRRIKDLLGVDLEAELQQSTTASEPSPPNYEVFVSAPISGLSDAEILDHQSDVAKVVAATEKVVDSVYWSGAKVRNPRNRGAADLSTEASLRALQGSRGYLYLQFAEMVNPSGALVELGIALGLGLKTTMILREGLNTPFMFEGLQNVAADLDFLPQVRIYVKDPDEAVRLIEDSGPELLLSRELADDVPVRT